MAFKIEAEGSKPWARVFTVPLDQIVIGENLARFADPPADVFDQFVESIRKDGQIYPVDALLLPDKRVKLTDGKQRFRALQRIEKETGEPQVIKVQVFQGNEEEAFWRALAANKERIPPTPMDEAKQIRIMRDKYNMSIADIASRFGKSEAWVTAQRLPLLQLSKKEQLLVHNNFLKADQGTIVAKIDPEKRDAVLERAAEIESKEQGKPVTVPTEQELVTPEPVPPVTEAVDAAPAEPPKKKDKKDQGVSTTSILRAATELDALPSSGAPEMKMKELKAYLQETVETEQEGSPIGALCDALLQLIARKLTPKQMDNRFAKYTVEAEAAAKKGKK